MLSGLILLTCAIDKWEIFHSRRSFDLNKWQNRISPQLLLSDVGVSGAAWYDWRGQQGRLWRWIMVYVPAEAVKAPSFFSPSGLVLA